MIAENISLETLPHLCAAYMISESRFLKWFAYWFPESSQGQSCSAFPELWGPEP